MQQHRRKPLWGMGKLSKRAIWQLQLPLKATLIPLSPGQAQIWGDSSLCLSWVISNVCLMISSLAFLYSSFSVVQLLSPTFLESAKCTNKCSSLPIKSGKQESCKFRRSNSTNPSCCDAADEGLWNRAIVLDSYYLGKTFGLLMHQIYLPCSRDHVHPRKSYWGIESTPHFCHSNLSCFFLWQRSHIAYVQREVFHFRPSSGPVSGKSE